MAITIEEVIKEYGDYYLKSGQNLSRLKSDLMQPSVTLKMFGTRVFTEDTIYQMANPVFSSLLQSFRRAFEPKGDVEFIPNKIELNHLKVDELLYPHDLEATWFGFLAGDDSKKIENWPIVRWMMEEHIIPQVQQDKELDAIYNGEHDPAGTTPKKSLDGLKKKLLEAANNTKYPLNIIKGINKFHKDTILDQLEEYDESINARYTNIPLIHFVSPYWMRMMLRDKRSKGWYMIDSPGKIDPIIDFTNHAVVALPSMTGTDDIFTTIRQNLIHVVKRPKNHDAANIDIQKSDRDVKLLVDWWEGIGFGCNKLVWTTEETVSQTSGSGS